MAVYTVLEPRRQGDAAIDRAEKFVFIRDGFSWSAFIFGPLWMLRHGLWLVLIGYLAIMAATLFGFRYLGASPDARFWVVFLIQLLLGFEAPTLRRWTLLRRCWIEHGAVVADDLEAAERRFFDRWVPDQSHWASEPDEPDTPRPLSGEALRPSQSGIIGLFPEPGGSR